MKTAIQELSNLSLRFNHVRIFHLETAYPGCCQALALMSPQDLHTAFAFCRSNYSLGAVHDCITYSNPLLSTFYIL